MFSEGRNSTRKDDLEESSQKRISEDLRSPTEVMGVDAGRNGYGADNVSLSGDCREALRGDGVRTPPGEARAPVRPDRKILAPRFTLSSSIVDFLGSSVN